MYIVNWVRMIGSHYRKLYSPWKDPSWSSTLGKGSKKERQKIVEFSTKGNNVGEVQFSTKKRKKRKVMG